MKPFIGDVESFRLIGADGILRNCSRSENADLFALAIGGYGCFGVYSAYYFSTHGNLYWSDTHQLSIYINDYHAKLDSICTGSEMITVLVAESFVDSQLFRGTC